MSSRNICRTAALFGLAESVVMITLSLLSASAHYCLLSVNEESTEYSPLQELYFNIDCLPSNYKFMDINTMNGVQTVLKPRGVINLTFIYLAASVAWFTFSLRLLNLNKKPVRNRKGLYCAWIGITLFIFCMDLITGFSFYIDSSRFKKAVSRYKLLSDESDDVHKRVLQLMLAQGAASNMKMVIWKGVVLLFVNIYLMYHMSLKLESVKDKSVNDKSVKGRSKLSITQASRLETYPPPCACLLPSNQRFKSLIQSDTAIKDFIQKQDDHDQPYKYTVPVEDGRHDVCQKCFMIFFKLSETKLTDILTTMENSTKDCGLRRSQRIGVNMRNEEFMTRFIETHLSELINLKENMYVVTVTRLYDKYKQSCKDISSFPRQRATFEARCQELLLQDKEAKDRVPKGWAEKIKSLMRKSASVDSKTSSRRASTNYLIDDEITIHAERELFLRCFLRDSMHNLTGDKKQLYEMYCQYCENPLTESYFNSMLRYEEVLNCREIEMQGGFKESNQNDRVQVINDVPISEDLTNQEEEVSCDLSTMTVSTAFDQFIQSVKQSFENF